MLVIMQWSKYYSDFARTGTMSVRSKMFRRTSGAGLNNQVQRGTANCLERSDSKKIYSNDVYIETWKIPTTYIPTRSYMELAFYYLPAIKDSN